MAERKTLYKRAGTVIRVLAWITILGWVGIGLAILIPAITGLSPKTKSIMPLPILSIAVNSFHIKSTMIFLSILLIAVLFVWLQFAVANAIQAHKDWGRVVGIIYGALNLLGFPIGTLIGGYILWCLIKGWDDNAAPASNSPGQGY